MPQWLEVREIVHFHKMLVEEHGGLHGIRNMGALESTLARPVNLIAYKPGASTSELAACYGFGFAKNHVFNDGNKRIALASIDVFLQINGFELVAGEVDAVCAIRDVATGTTDEQQLTSWIKQNSRDFNLDN
jgi:death-on-curing protein